MKIHFDSFHKVSGHMTVIVAVVHMTAFCPLHTKFGKDI